MFARERDLAGTMQAFCPLSRRWASLRCAAARAKGAFTKRAKVLCEHQLPVDASRCGVLVVGGVVHPRKLAPAGSRLCFFRVSVLNQVAGKKRMVQREQLVCQDGQRPGVGAR